ncbi:hypothetical protein PHYPO_G00076800 [Pangasianodon hypophthalmus]|uniref:C1q domain-containing protein n=1 Tax=Pangasianodon hypophthalmus TaxID=310915 RepID=A0A5N5LKJ4_PANHP|nr:hypothetical protein PHYPO_G00076800 [Pangasianodon hypophthalmus]
MKSTVAVLALLVCVTWAAPVQEDEAPTKTAVEVSESKQQTDQLTDGLPKVAFSVGSGYEGTYGPFNTAVTLVFKKVITNVGNLYSPHTGIFKAPVRGVYHFSASVFGNTQTLVEVYLMKNGQRVFGMSESPKGSNMSMSRAINLLLEQGDEVYLNLRAHTQMYDDGQTYNTFSGFLLFPM